MNNRFKIISFGLFFNFVYFLGALSASGDSHFEISAIYLLYAVSIILAATIYMKFPKRVLAKSIEKKRKKIDFAFTFIFPLFFTFLCVVLYFVLPPDKWFSPGLEKYQNYSYRNGFMFAFVQTAGLVVAVVQKSNVKRIFVLTSFFLAVFVVLGRNPSATYIIYLLIIIGNTRKRFLFLLLCMFVGAGLVNSFRAVGLDFDGIIAHLVRHGFISYIVNSAEFSVGARIFSVVQDGVLNTPVRELNWYYPILAPFTLFPLSLIADHFLDLWPLSRLISDQYHTTGGLPLMMEGYYLFFGLIGAFVYSLFHLSIIAIFLGAIKKHFSNEVVLVIFLFILLNANRIEAITLWNFAYTQIVMLMMLNWILIYVFRVRANN
jgi:hypothetical protein